ncbi:hypothetical protein FACS1894162_5710 [Bacteroidia bacterium]|nr:hypothetical protein FACS1894162_5710 [Bacteroidia bacterium]
MEIKVSGYGNVISSLLLDGEKQNLPFILPTNAAGKHRIEIEMKSGAKSVMNLVEAGTGKCHSPIEPVLALENGNLVWNQVQGETYYLWDGKTATEVNSPLAIDQSQFGNYHIYAVDKKGFESDLSNPIMIAPVTSRSKPSNAAFSVDIPKENEGKYLLKLVAANGNGPHGTYCAIRSVFVDGKDVGTFIVEANGDWTKWTNSNYLVVDNLKEGKHRIELKLNPENKGFDDNMSRNKEKVNDCKIDYLELIYAK